MASEEFRDGKHHHFHYSREERLAGKGEPEEPRPKGLFKRNRSLTIILLDVLLIVIMLLLFQFVFTPGRGSVREGDFRLDLTAFRFEGEVYATLEVTRTRMNDGPLEGGQMLMVIRFEGQEPILDTLPAGIDDTITASMVLADDGSEDGPAVRVEVELLDRTVKLVTRPKR